jgi:hypothetical protein
MTVVHHDPALAQADPRLFSDYESQVRTLGLAGAASSSVGPRIYTANGDGSFSLDGGASRQFAVNSFPTYPGGGPQVTVDTAVRFPNIIARALIDLTYQRFVADRILSRGTPDQVAGGAAVFQRAEGLFPDRGAEQINVRSEWPRSGWTVPDLYAAAVQKFGLEVPIADEARRRNAIDELARAQRKLANAVIKFVDATAMALIMNDPAINTFTSSNTWGSGSANILGDLAAARNLINNADLGYEADTLIIHPNQELNMLTDATIRTILPRESTPRNAAITGNPVPLLGLNQILVTNQMTSGTALLVQSGVVGSIAEENPRPEEGYTTYATPGLPTIWVKTYREEDRDESIVRGARFPAMWISEPRAVTKISGI